MAQSSTWLGIELGDPSGITLFSERPNRTDLEFLAAWDLDDFLFVNAHMLWRAGQTVEPGIYFRYGPGLFVGFRDRGRNNDDEFLAGVSFRVSAEYGWDRFAVYLALTPRMAIIERTDGDLGGALGFRMRL